MVPEDVMAMFEAIGRKITLNEIENSFKYAKVYKNKMSFEDFKEYYNNFWSIVSLLHHNLALINYSARWAKKWYLAINSQNPCFNNAWYGNAGFECVLWNQCAWLFIKHKHHSSTANANRSTNNTLKNGYEQPAMSLCNFTNGSEFKGMSFQQFQHSVLILMKVELLWRQFCRRGIYCWAGIVWESWRCCSIRCSWRLVLRRRRRCYL